MASKDFVYDLKDQIEKEGFDYLIVTIDSGKKSNNVDVFYLTKTDDSSRTMQEILRKVTEMIESESDDPSDEGTL